LCIAKNIKTKLASNNAVILNADKGNTIVVCYDNEYYSKPQQFIFNNQFSTVENDPHLTFQKERRKVVKNCTATIHKEEKWKYINLNPSAPIMKALPKIHKTNSPIRLIISWQSSPAYKLAKLLSKLLQFHIPSPNAFSIKNSVQLMDNLKEIPIILDSPHLTLKTCIQMFLLMN